MDTALNDPAMLAQASQREEIKIPVNYILTESFPKPEMTLRVHSDILLNFHVFSSLSIKRLKKM